MRHKKIIFPATALLLSGVSIAGVISTPELLSNEPGDSAELSQTISTPTDTTHGQFDRPMPAGDAESRYKRLTDEDFLIVADELGVELAAIKAVVRIEAGASMTGFWAPGVPVINPDRSLYNRYAKLASNRNGDKSAQVPAGLTGAPLARWKKLTQWRRVNAEGADMGTLWGMFQISGAAFKQCDCTTIQEFVKRMSNSEFDQLELFAAFITNTGYVEYIRKLDWAGFARRYNGPSYARRGYHTRMAAEYAKFKKAAETSQASAD